jgi:hypothetical protein
MAHRFPSGGTSWRNSSYWVASTSWYSSTKTHGHRAWYPSARSGSSRNSASGADTSSSRSTRFCSRSNFRYVSRSPAAADAAVVRCASSATLKSAVSPAAAGFSRSSRRPNAWNVATVTCSASAPSSTSSRLRISSAARRVNVMARHWSGRTPSSAHR